MSRTSVIKHITDEINYYQQLEIGQGQREPLDGRGRGGFVGWFCEQSGIHREYTESWIDSTFKLLVIVKTALLFVSSLAFNALVRMNRPFHWF